jgi:hypothetical protein
MNGTTADLQEQLEIGDDKLVKVIVKIRDAKAEATRAYKAQMAEFDKQREQLDAELLKRLQQRGATQTKTSFGTAYIGEDLSVTIADDQVLHAFLDETDDPYGWFQKRIKIERLREYMKEHQGGVPPGLNIFREATINVRAS